MIKRILTLICHWREAKSAFSTLSYLYDGKSTALDALGGLTEEEMAGLVRWLPEEGTFVEVGTLFGLTAKRIAADKPKLKVIGIDNFSWNPFGLPSRVHEAFTRQILGGSGVELVNCSSEEFMRGNMGGIDAVFFDASHQYEDVRAECEWAKRVGIETVCGHDYNNANRRFGVTRAVDEVFGKENVETCGMCWRVKCEAKEVRG